MINCMCRWRTPWEVLPGNGPIIFSELNETDLKRQGAHSQHIDNLKLREPHLQMRKYIFNHHSEDLQSSLQNFQVAINPFRHLESNLLQTAGQTASTQFGFLLTKQK